MSMAESNDSIDVKETQADDDLDNLLDSALDDFTELKKEKPLETDDSKDVKGEVDDMWSEMVKQALQANPDIQEMLQQGSDGDSNFVEDFSKIAEAAAKVIESDCPNNFADIMTETLRNLNENSENIQNQFGNPDELASLFQELGLNGGVGSCPDGSLEDIPPFMQNIMQSFMSKDVLYPSIKEFVDKYPVWLEEHKDSLSAEEYDNYCKQLEIMKKVVEEFEAENESDSEDVKKQRFRRIMGYMQQMQSLGQPPMELITGDSSDDSATPAIPPGLDPNQCSTM